MSQGLISALVAVEVSKQLRQGVWKYAQLMHMQLYGIPFDFGPIIFYNLEMAATIPAIEWCSKPWFTDPGVSNNFLSNE
jgi:hypothetical protein